MERKPLSLVIPAHNEERRLGRGLETVLDFMSARWVDFEVIIVDNASTDRTAALAEELRRERSSNVKLVREPRLGKGAAVRAGVLASEGEHVAFSDCDLSVPIDELERFAASMEDFDVAIASREAPGSRRIGEPIYRHVMGRVFNGLVRALVLPRFHDAQCGFKCFRRAAALDLFRDLSVTGWAFDVEILSLATKRGYRVAELGVPWYFDGDTRIVPLRDALVMTRDVWQIRQRARAIAAAPGPAPAREPRKSV